MKWWKIKMKMKNEEIRKWSNEILWRRNGKEENEKNNIII